MLDRSLAFSIGLNALIVIVEVAGGLVSGSLALLSILVLLLILRSGWELLRDTVRIRLEGTPSGLDLVALQRDVQERFDVCDLHHVHVWELNAGRRVLSAHVRMPAIALAEAETLLGRIREHLVVVLCRQPGKTLYRPPLPASQHSADPSYWG